MNSNKNTDNFKDSIRKKIGKDESTPSSRDHVIWENVLNEISDKKEVSASWSKKKWFALAACIALLLSCTLGVLIMNKSTITMVSEDRSESIIREEQVFNESNSPQDLRSAQNVEGAGVGKPLESSKIQEVKTKGMPDFSKSENVTSEGGRLEYMLPDGSFAALNFKTVLKVNKNFKEQRNLLLGEGEAYFEVQHDPAKPFSVFFDNHRLLVVGTKFNVRHLPEEEYKEITVSEGKVRVFINNKDSVDVSSGEQLRIYISKEPSLLKVNPQNAISWKNRFLAFDKTRLEDVMRMLERHFQIEIILEPKVQNCRFTGDLSELSQEEALLGLSMANSLKVDTLDNKFYITGKGCE
ncbi:MAG: FecR family protein [Cytophagaceae bacterium]